MSDPAPLSFSQTANLFSILHDASVAPDARALSYYQALASYGYPYGSLAAGVAAGGSVEGALADSFLINYANAHFEPINSTALSQIHLALAEADLTARTDAGGADISGLTIKDYHADVYSAAGYDGAGWIFDTPYQLLGNPGWNAALNLGAAGDLSVGAAILALAVPSNQFNNSQALMAQNWLLNFKDAAVDAAQSLSGPDLSHVVVTPRSDGSFDFSIGPEFDPSGVQWDLTIQPNGQLAKSIAYSPDKTVTNNFVDGQPIASDAVYVAGGDANTVYSTDPNTSWYSQTDIKDATGNIIGTATVNRDGTTDLVSIGASGKQVTTHLDENGKITSQTADPGIDYNNFVTAIAERLQPNLFPNFLLATISRPRSWLRRSPKHPSSRPPLRPPGKRSTSHRYLPHQPLI